MKYYLENPPPVYNEEFVVRYWGKDGEFSKQKEISIYFASKNRHDQAVKVACSVTGCRKVDIIGCSYQ